MSTDKFENSRTASVLAKVMAERARQVKKWGLQKQNPLAWISILTEEVGEAAKEANDTVFKVLPDMTPEQVRELHTGLLEKLRTELIRVAAVAVSAIEDIERRGVDVCNT